MNILVTGGTVFVSRSITEYFVNGGHNVYVLNRGSRPQPDGVLPIIADRYDLGEKLRGMHFDAVIDAVAYNEHDIDCLLNALGEYDRFVMISSSAVYPETLPQPFNEQQTCGANSYWGDYGTNKIAAEQLLINRVPDAYIIRPPYLYGKMNNLYREAFVFDCAELDMPFYLPRDGSMKLQFFDIEDLCRFTEILLEKQPERHIYNVGNTDPITISDWVTQCYAVFGKKPLFKNVYADINQREYFPFLGYEYTLDVTEQNKLMPHTKPLAAGLRESWDWYKENRGLVRVKPLIDYIEKNLSGAS
ncbi:MAG: NAD-dependent epimerase/dehydratase family protein [Eubacterium sp.]|nr:NAD-dependent epimerase/dehydratase family protein [Eubacterium sp.]